MMMMMQEMSGTKYFTTNWTVVVDGGMDNGW